MAGGMNSLGRLNEILFAELERLNALDVSDKDAVAAECSRSKAIQNVAREVNQSSKTVMEAARFRAEWAGARGANMPKLLEG